MPAGDRQHAAVDRDPGGEADDRSDDHATGPEVGSGGEDVVEIDVIPRRGEALPRREASGGIDAAGKRATREAGVKQEHHPVRQISERCVRRFDLEREDRHRVRVDRRWGDPDPRISGCEPARGDQAGDRHAGQLPPTSATLGS